MKEREKEINRERKIDRERERQREREITSAEILAQFNFLTDLARETEN